MKDSENLKLCQGSHMRGLESLKNGKLYNCSQESWCKDLPVGNHMMKDSLLEETEMWITPEGHPQKAA